MLLLLGVRSLQVEQRERDLVAREAAFASALARAAEQNGSIGSSGMSALATSSLLTPSPSEPSPSEQVTSPKRFTKGLNSKKRTYRLSHSYSDENNSSHMLSGGPISTGSSIQLASTVGIPQGSGGQSSTGGSNSGGVFKAFGGLRTSRSTTALNKIVHVTSSTQTQTPTL